MEIKLAAARDATAIRDLTRAAYAKWAPGIGREPKPMGADYDAAVREHRIDLLYLDGELAALIETIDQGDRLLIENVAVSPAHQRRGLGSNLIAHAEAIAASLGYEKVWLYTNRRFVGNVEFYARLGYREDNDEDVGAGLGRTNMSKILLLLQRRDCMR